MRFLIIFLIKVTWYEAHCFNHMWLDSPVVPVPLGCATLRIHLSPDFSPFTWTEYGVPTRHHLLPPSFPLPCKPWHPTSVIQPNHFYFPFSPQSVFLLFLSEENMTCLYLSDKFKARKRHLSSDSGESRKEPGIWEVPGSPPLEAEAIACGLTSGWSQVA